MKKLLVVGAVSLMLALTGCGDQNTAPAPQPISQDGKGQPGPVGPDGQVGPDTQCGFGEELEQELDGTWECDDDDHKKKPTTAVKPPAVKQAPKPPAAKPAAPKPAAPKPAAPKPATKK
jgi:hypothetical protein